MNPFALRSRDAQGTGPEAARFPSRNARRSLPLFRRAGDGRDQLLAAGRDTLDRRLRGDRRDDRPERRTGGSAGRLHHLPWARGPRRRRGRAAPRRARRRLSPAPADGVCRRTPTPSADAAHRRADHRGGAPRRGRLLRGVAAGRTARSRDRPACGGVVPRGRPGPRPARLLGLPRGAGARPRTGLSAAGGAACTVPRPADQAVASRRAAHRSARIDAPDQPASDSVGIRGSRGLRVRAARGSSQSGTSGSIPRSTSCLFQK